MDRESKKAISTVVFIAIIIVLLVSMSVLVVIQIFDSEDRNIAEIYQNGILITTVNIAESEGFKLRIDDGNGGFNIVSVLNGKIGVEETNCSDKTCLNMGYISDGRFPIICLPHKAEIRLVKNTSGIDGISY